MCEQNTRYDIIRKIVESSRKEDKMKGKGRVSKSAHAY